MQEAFPFYWQGGGFELLESVPVTHQFPLGGEEGRLHMAEDYCNNSAIQLCEAKGAWLGQETLD